MRVRFTLGARWQLDQIFAYIAKDSPVAARRVVDRIEYVGELLGDQPRMGRMIKFRGLLALPVWGTPYIIYYRIVGEEVEIVRVRHSARRRLV